MILKHQPDNCCLLKNGCNVIVHDMYTTSTEIDVDNSTIEMYNRKVSQFLFPKAFFHLPCNSNILGISIITANKVSDFFIIKPEEIITKCLLLPIESNIGTHVLLPMIHTYHN